MKKIILITLLFVSAMQTFSQGAIEAAVEGELMQVAFLGLNS